MKRIRREILGNIALTVGLVGVVCFGLATFGKTEMGQSNIVTYRTSRAPAATQPLGGDRSWLVPNIAQSDFHASSARRSVRTAIATAPAATATGQSIVSTGLQGGTSVGGSTASGGTATTHRSAAVAGSSVAHISGSIASSGSSRSSRTVTVSEPFADDNSGRPSARPRPKVGPDGGKEEQFPEDKPPIGSALVPLLLCAGAYVVWQRRKNRRGAACHARRIKSKE